MLKVVYEIDPWDTPLNHLNKCQELKNEIINEWFQSNFFNGQMDMLTFQVCYESKRKLEQTNPMLGTNEFALV